MTFIVRETPMLPMLLRLIVACALLTANASASAQDDPS